MIRGKDKIAKLTAGIFDCDLTQVSAPVQEKKRIMDKYELMFYRYYYYCKIHKMKFDELIFQLEREFFISGGRIADILTMHSSRIKAISAEAPTVNRLAELYPSYVWAAPKPAKPTKKLY